jgi:hypothetical protein
LSAYGTTTANGPSPAQSPDGSTAQQAKDKAQETAQRTAGEAKARMRDQVDQRSTEAGHRVGAAAQDARSVSDELRKQGKDQPAKLIEQVADRAESLRDYLQRSDGETIVRDVEDFGRQRPWAVIAGGVALGFAASRFLKASSTRRSETRTSSSSTNGLTASPPPTRASLAVGDALSGAPSPVPTGGSGGVSPVDTPTTGPGFVPPDRGL